MDWIKVKVKHAEYEFLGASDSIFRTWIMMMIFVAAIERKPLRKQLEERLGKSNYEDLESWLGNNGLSIDTIITKVLEDVEKVNNCKLHNRKYMQEYRSKTLHKPLRGDNVNGKRREEKRREDIYSKQPSAALKAVLDKVFKDGFNIYSLINKVKKQLKWPAQRSFPEEVLLKVADRYFKEKAVIKEPWPWFLKTLEMESGSFYANKNIAQAQEFKKPGALSLKEIMEQALKEKAVK